jgi:hypothetical protein
VGGPYLTKACCGLSSARDWEETFIGYIEERFALDINERIMQKTKQRAQVMREMRDEVREARDRQTYL